MKSGEKQGLIARKCVIPVGSIHKRGTVNQGGGANREVRYPWIRFLQRHIRGSVKNFCQQVQTSNHHNTLLKTAGSPPSPIAVEECSIIKTFSFGRNGHVLHFAMNEENNALRARGTRSNSPGDHLPAPGLSSGGEVNHAGVIFRDFLKIIPCRDIF
jgi:hypothetical protein